MVGYVWLINVKKKFSVVILKKVCDNETQHNLNDKILFLMSLIYYKSSYSEIVVSHI